jgi:peptidoglycan/xylan/chitin deacetylase (PgdA/CDA1 family)
MTERGLRRLVLLLLSLVVLNPSSAAETSATPTSAVVLLYHHVAEDTPASTSVSPATFAAHLKYLDEGGYHVVALSELIRHVRRGEPLPPRSVAITFDDGYRSVQTTAAPMLARRGWPYAVFVSTDYVDRGYAGYLSWDALRSLESGGAEIGNHSRSHAHFPARMPGEGEPAWRERITDDVRWAQRRLREELRQPLQAVAYPYGEFDTDVASIITALDLVGFGQQSGPVDHRSDPATLSRFPMAGSYATLDSLGEKLRTRPLPVAVLAPAARIRDAGSPAPTLRLRLEAPATAADIGATLRCYVTGQPPATVRWLDRDAGEFEVTATAALPVGRSKYTCTAPVPGNAGSFFWYSHLWMTRPPGGGWYDG